MRFLLSPLHPAGNFESLSVLEKTGMQRRIPKGSRFVRWMAWSGALACGAALAAVPGDNPYAVITNRNAFGIRPPPEPEPPPVVVPPPAAPPNIFLTGVSHSGGQKKAYFAINRPGGKTQEYETIHEGEELQDLKVLEIDAKAGRVRAMVAGREVSLTFAENGLKAAAGGAVPGAPGAVPRPGQPIPAPVAPVPMAGVGGGGSGPVVIGRGGVNLNPAQPMVTTAGVPGVPTYTPGAPTADVSGGYSAPMTRSLPGRPNAVAPSPIQNAAPIVDSNGRIPLPLPPARPLP
jgi:hypothetical protein